MVLQYITGASEEEILGYTFDQFRLRVNNVGNVLPIINPFIEKPKKELTGEAAELHLKMSGLWKPKNKK